MEFKNTAYTESFKSNQRVSCHEQSADMSADCQIIENISGGVNLPRDTAELLLQTFRPDGEGAYDLHFDFMKRECIPSDDTGSWPMALSIPGNPYTFTFHPNMDWMKPLWEKKKAEGRLSHTVPKQSLVEFRLQNRTNGTLKQKTTYLLHVTESHLPSVSDANVSYDKQSTRISSRCKILESVSGGVELPDNTAESLLQMLCANREDDDGIKTEFVDEKDDLCDESEIWTTMFSIKQDQDKKIFKFHPHTCVVQEHWEKIKKAEDILRNEKLVHLKLPKQSLVKFRLQTHTNGELKQKQTYFLHVTESRPSENILQSQRKMYQSQASKLGPALQDLARLILKMQIYSIEFDKIPVSQQMEKPCITLLNLEQLVFDEADARFTQEERFVMALGLGTLGLGRSDDGFLRCLTAENSDAVSSVLADSDFKYIVRGKGYEKAIEHRREEAKYDNSEFWNETILKYEKEAAKITRYLKMFFPPESVPSPGSKIHVNKLDSVDHARILRYAPHRFKVSGNTSELQGVICLGPDSELLALSAFVEGVKDLDKKNIEQLERHICAEIEQSQPKGPDHKRTEGEDMASKTAESMDGLESEKSRSDVQVRHFELHPHKKGTLLTFGVMSEMFEEWAIKRPMEELCDSSYHLKERYQSFLTKSISPEMRLEMLLSELSSVEYVDYEKTGGYAIVDYLKYARRRFFSTLDFVADKFISFWG